jgi:uncharacterized protein YodC (DUF2158 family)
MKIKNGSTVFLKTVSPPRLVREVRADGWFVCEWHEAGETKSEAFPMSALRTPDESATRRKEAMGGFAPRPRMVVVEHLDIETERSQPDYDGHRTSGRPKGAVLLVRLRRLQIVGFFVGRDRARSVDELSEVLPR